MPKANYNAIIAEIKTLVKEIKGLQKRVLTLKDKVYKKNDEQNIAAVRKKMGL